MNGEKTLLPILDFNAVHQLGICHLLFLPIYGVHTAISVYSGIYIALENYVYHQVMT